MSNGKRPLSSDESGALGEPPVKRQKITNRILEQFQNIAQQNKHNDVQFIVGQADNKQTFNGNKLLFSAQSKVFEAMLFGPLAQSANEAIQILDVKPIAFDYLHKLFCMKQPQLTYDIVVDVLYAAQKYLIDVIGAECKQKLYSINNMDDVYLVLSSFEQYAPSVFGETIQNFLKNTKFIGKNLIKLINDVRFGKLQPFMIENMIDTDLFPTETYKYAFAKKYCIKFESESWQSFFIEHFLDKIDLHMLSSSFLVSTVRNDKIVSADGLLDILSLKVEKERNDNASVRFTVMSSRPPDDINTETLCVRTRIKMLRHQMFGTVIIPLENKFNRKFRSGLSFYGEPILNDCTPQQLIDEFDVEDGAIICAE